MRVDAEGQREVGGNGWEQGSEMQSPGNILRGWFQRIEYLQKCRSKAVERTIREGSSTYMEF